MKQFYGEDLSVQTGTASEKVRGAPAMQTDMEQPVVLDYMPDDFAQRLHIEELAAGSDGRGFVMIFDRLKY